MNALADAGHGPFGRITVTFEEHPGLFVRPEFGCPVETGDRSEVLLCTGKLIEL